jgi:type I restriction enzyme R subunit
VGDHVRQADAWRDRFAAIAFEDKGGSHPGRYYQDIAVERVLQAIASGQQRILLTLATGTGKTFIAFQLAWKLFQARWNLSREPSRRPRILFPRRPQHPRQSGVQRLLRFPGRCPGAHRAGRHSQEGQGAEERQPVLHHLPDVYERAAKRTVKPSPYFGEYPPDFFDFIVIDECHRGGANDESNWRDILEYFAPAVQLGLTATPKRKDNVDTYAYFGEPVYTYSLKDGINDGFLTPFKVKQISTTLDEYVFTPDDTVVEGEMEAGKRYEEADFNKIIEIKEARSLPGQDLHGADQPA